MCMCILNIFKSFTAAFTVILPGGVQPYQKDSIIKYSEVLDNDGNAYDPSTGIFTVDMDGFYSISVTMMSGLVTAHTTLRKNGAILTWLYTNNNYNMASQTVNLQLLANDTIWVQMNNKASRLFDVYNTFSAVWISYN